MVDFLYGEPKTCQLFETSVVLPPSGKISAGAHERTDTSSWTAGVPDFVTGWTVEFCMVNLAKTFKAVEDFLAQKSKP